MADLIAEDGLITDEDADVMSVERKYLCLGTGFHISDTGDQLTGKGKKLRVGDVLSPRDAMDFVVAAEITAIAVEDCGGTELVITLASCRIDIDTHAANDDRCGSISRKPRHLRLEKWSDRKKIRGRLWPHNEFTLG